MIFWFAIFDIVGCPETSVGNFHYSLSNNPKERSSQHAFLVQALGRGKWPSACPDHFTPGTINSTTHSPPHQLKHSGNGKNICAQFKVLKIVLIKILVFWYTMPCRLVYMYRYFMWACYSHLKSNTITVFFVNKAQHYCKGKGQERQQKCQTKVGGTVHRVRVRFARKLKEETKHI